MKRNEVVAWAVARGWRASTTDGGHIRLQHGQAGLYFMASTPSCPRSAQNAKSGILRAERRRGVIPATGK